MRTTGAKSCLLGWALMVGATQAFGDDMILLNGTSVRGAFSGFSEHRFLFKAIDGTDYAEFGANVQSIRLDRPLFVSAQFLSKRFDNVAFTGYSQFRVRLLRGIDEMAEPVTMLKGMQVFVPKQPETPGPGETARVAQPPVGERPPAFERVAGEHHPTVEASDQPIGERDWKRAGRWREESLQGGRVISHGEDIDIDRALDKNMANVVHFHLPSSLASVREGSYLSSLAGKRDSRFVVKRIEIQDWKVPICLARDLKSLPQFWFYSRSGRLVVKLINRFTESDIDAALKQAILAD